MSYELIKPFSWRSKDLKASFKVRYCLSRLLWSLVLRNSCEPFTFIIVLISLLITSSASGLSRMSLRPAMVLAALRSASGSNNSENSWKLSWPSESLSNLRNI
jgi:hypothetical protein